jgi:hypothetical protein
MTQLAKLWWNPIVAKELRSRMHGWHAAAVLTGYLCVIGGLGYLSYSSEVGSSYSVLQAGVAGAGFFRALAVAAMVTIALVVPGLVGPALSGEREHRTLELLLVTPLRPGRIVVGKLVAALAFVVLLTVACVPLFSVAFLLGGVRLSQVLGLLGFTLVAAFSLGSLSMLVSAAVRRVGGAPHGSYVANLALIAGPLIGGYALDRAVYPSTASAGLSVPDEGLTGAPGVVYAISPVVGVDGLLENGQYCNSGPFFNPAGGFISPAISSCGPGGQYLTSLGPLGTWQTWQASLAFDGAIALVALGGSVLVLRRKEMA